MRQVHPDAVFYEGDLADQDFMRKVFKENPDVDAVIHFAETGDPNHLGIPQWPVSTEDREATMIFDRVCTVRFNFDDSLLELYKKALPNLTLANITQEDNQIQH